MTVGTATRIYKKRVSNNIFKNIIENTNLLKMWEKLCIVCLQVGQRVVYFIFQELLNHFCNIKPKKFEKSVISIFANIQFLIKWLQLAIIQNGDIGDSITIVVAPDSLYDNFETITTNILKHNDKIIKEIQQTFVFTKAKFLTKCVMKVTADSTIMSKNKGSSKHKVTSNNRYYNCHKFGYFV